MMRDASRSERTTFLIALAVVAVHVLDDNFAQTEAGTSPSDHVVSGLVPLSIMSLAALGYARWRPGVRSIVAICLGLFGITVAVEGWYGTIMVGPTGDDFSGLLAAPAGFVLVFLGLWTLWTHRRRDDRPLRRLARYALICVISAISLLEVVYPIVYGYLATHLAPARVPTADLHAEYQSVTLTTSDGLELAGWYVPSQNRAAVIAIPGRDGPQAAARVLARHGYGVLLFDRRGEGESEGEPNASGWGGTRDVAAALAFLQSQPDVDPRRIGGIGLSVGGELLIETAARTPALAATVSEGAGIRSVREHMHRAGIGKWITLPLHANMTLRTAVFSNQLPPPDLADLIGEIAPRPVLLIQAQQAQGGEELNPVYFAAAGDPKALWLVPDSTHVGGLEAHPVEYEQRLIGFLDRALLDTV